MTACACKTKRQLVATRVGNNAAIIFTESGSEILTLFLLSVVFTLSFVNLNLIAAYCNKNKTEPTPPPQKTEGTN